MLDLHRLCRDMSSPKSALRRSAERLVRDIFGFLREPSDRTAKQLAGWRENFRVIYGEVSLSAHRRLNPEAVLASFGVAPEGDREERMRLLLFASQTYFTLLLKAAMAAVLGGESGDWSGMILGNFARARGIVNYCGQDWYCWPAEELARGFDRIMEDIAKQLLPYRKSSGEAVCAGRDDIKALYEALIPRQLRHALGEYYTPDWLAAYTLDKALELHGGNVRDLRIADPACGSGTFLTQAIARKRAAGAGWEDILRTVRGGDINPLAALTARSNYLLSILDLLGGGPLEIPVVRADALDAGAEAEKADLVVGNPPWINWEYLPPAYRARSQHLWNVYDLLDEKGISLSFLKTDVSDLLAYAAADRLLADGGTLAFLVRQGVFKSAQNGAGFRKFRLPDGTDLKVLRVDDFSRLKIFEGTAASAAALFLRKGERTVYPVPYAVWNKAPGMKRGPVSPRLPPEQVPEAFCVQEQSAVPAAGADGPWLTAPARELEGLERMLGSNPYRARTGVFTGGANAVYWLTILSGGEGTVRAANLQARAKRKTGQAEVDLEDAYLYPMLRGGGIRRWRTGYDAYLLCPHTAETKLRPVPWEQLVDEAPKTAAYLASRREVLDQRKGFAGWERAIQRQEFHAVLRVGSYTFAPWKVVWKYIATSFVCAVIGEVDDPFLGRKLLLPNEKVMYISTDCREEAYYLCGVLSSTPAAGCVKGYMNPTSISAHVLERLRIPRYDGANPVHRAIAEICREGHAAGEIGPYLERIDRLTAEL